MTLRVLAAIVGAASLASASTMPGLTEVQEIDEVRAETKDLGMALHLMIDVAKFATGRGQVEQPDAARPALYGVPELVQKTGRSVRPKGD